MARLPARIRLQLAAEPVSRQPIKTRKLSPVAPIEDNRPRLRVNQDSRGSQGSQDSQDSLDRNRAVRNLARLPNKPLPLSPGNHKAKKDNPRASSLARASSLGPRLTANRAVRRVTLTKTARPSRKPTPIHQASAETVRKAAERATALVSKPALREAAVAIPRKPTLPAGRGAMLRTGSNY